MVPPSSHRIPRVRRYFGYRSPSEHFVYRTVTFFGCASHRILLCSSVLSAVRTPKILLLSVWPAPRSLATTCGISFDFFSSAYLDVSVQQVPFPSGMTVASRVPPFGYLRIISLICSSPQLFAACRVLLRLLMPRHPPCALRSLTLYEFPYFRLIVFRRQLLHNFFFTKLFGFQGA